MTYNEIVDPYLKMIGMARNRESHTIEVIFPHIVLDVQADIFNHNIRGLETKHRAHKLKNLWHEEYLSFNTDFFRAYRKGGKPDGELTDVIIRFMDSFTEYIYPFINEARDAIEKAAMLDGRTKENASIISNCYISNALAKAAQTIYEKTYRTKRNHDKSNQSIDRMMYYSREFAKCYGSSYISVTDDLDEKIDKAINSLIRHIVKWLFDESPKVNIAA